MIITRWQAELTPNQEQIRRLFEVDGLEPTLEVFKPSKKILEHRHPFCEVRIIVSGELLINISGNQILLRTGDKIEIPPNTKHSYSTQGDCECVSMYTQKLV